MNMVISDIWAKRQTLRDSGVLRGSRDLHSHLLYGVDDGITDPEESLEALAYEESIGVREVWCTPHIMEEVPNDTACLKQRFAELQNIYQGPIVLHLAAEYMMDNLFLKRLHDGDILTISGNVILTEVSTAGTPYGFEGILSNMMSAGFRPLIAHPERYGFMKEREYFRLREMGVLFQLNIASLTGYYGKAARMRAEFLLKKGMYNAYGSDCHSARALHSQYSESWLSADILRRIALLDDNL